MDKTQREIAAQMLQMAADEFSNHGCNDYNLPLTPENLEFVKGMIAASDYPEDEPHIYEKEQVIMVMYWQLMRYCARLLEQEKK